MNIRTILLSILIVSFVLSACQAATPVVLSTDLLPTMPVATETPRPTTAPSSTPVPPTPTLTPTPQPTATATPTLTPTSLFANFRVLYSDYLQWGFMIAFSLPGVVQPYDLRVNKLKYSCTLSPNVLDQMFCIGGEFEPGSWVELEFFPLNATSTAEPVFKSNYLVIPVRSPTPEGFIPSSSEGCPVRGIGVSCETENRGPDWPGGPCIVSTCVDICGYWYSIDTCE